MSEPRGVPVEVRAEQHLHPADGAVSFRFVEELVHEAPQLALVAEEPLQRPWQPAFPIREVLAQHHVQGSGRLLVRGLRLAQQPLELRSDRVYVDRHADALDRRQTDAQGALDQERTFLGRAVGDEGRQSVVIQHEVLDDEPIRLEPDRRRPGLLRRERDELGGFHARIVTAPGDS